MLVAPSPAAATHEGTSSAKSRAGAWPGYTLFAAIATPSVYLVDLDGEVVHTWEAETPTIASHLLENGNLLRAGQAMVETPITTGGRGGLIEELAWDGTVVWRFEYANDTSLQHHDVEKLPNGNVLFLGWQRKTTEEAVARGRDPELLADGELHPDSILEYDPSIREIVWEWHVWDHLVQDRDPAAPDYGVIAEEPGRIDLNYAPDAGASWNHLNGIDYHPGRDEIIVSSRQFSEIWIVDHATTTEEARGPAGDLRFRWGNPEAYGRGSSSTRELFLQHDPSWITKGLRGAGRILVFNNGDRDARDFTSVDEIEPVRRNGAYATDRQGRYLPKDTTRVYPRRASDERFFTEIVGSAQRLANGNTLIGDAQAGRILEVTKKGKVVWEFRNPFHPPDQVEPTETDDGIVIAPWRIFHAYRYPIDYRGIVGRGIGADTASEGPRY
jgi:hypothetical protein